ncbi:hypothetical protein M0805_001733 [Coniferiporia weirii]|nr:hypothetical protein M0805_001733 [Coniferiporia weirii]
MSAPSKPLDIRSPRSVADQLSAPGSPGHLAVGTPTGRTARLGTPSTPPIANIPLRGGDGSPGLPASFGSRSFTIRPRTPLTGGASTPANGTGESPAGARMPLDDVTDEEMVRVLRRHLVPRRAVDVDDSVSVNGSRRASDSLASSVRNGTTGSNGAQPSPSIPQQDELEPFPIPYDAPGGDITHSIYKWQADQRRQAVRPRAASLIAPAAAPPHPALEHIHKPGGFRRDYVIRRANEQGFDEPVVSNNFIEFLYLFGHFAGEDLEEDEEEEDDAALLGQEEGIAGPTGVARTTLAQLEESSETAPLLPREASKRSISRARRSRRASVGPHGDATVTQAVLMLMKSFIGTGVLFLGKAFFNGGILFSTLMLVGIALISLYSFLLLLKAKTVVRGSFGDIGGKLYGPWMRYAILTSIAVSQLGFVSAYTIFISENLRAFVLAVTNCVHSFPVQYFILLQLILLLPLVLVRNIAKLSSAALVADVFILAGLLYIFGSEFAIIADRGIAKVELFNPKDFPLLIGTAVFSFEGVGLVIPISDSMREPRKFPAVLTAVMLFLIVLFGGAGVLAYLTFGSEIQTLVITNLDTDKKLVQIVQFLYSVAILLSVPLQLFPAIRIMENGLFTRSGKGDLKVKWQKNIFRFFIAAVTALVSWAGASDLDKFVSLVGSFACVPLCYVYPAMLHYRACARTRKAKIADILLMIFGTAAAIYTTLQTIKLILAPSEGVPSSGRCDAAPSP